MAVYDSRNDRILSQAIDETDYVQDGKVYKKMPTSIVMVGSSSDLDLLTDYNPGTFAYTANLEHVWIMGVDCSWNEIQS